MFHSIFIKQRMSQQGTDSPFLNDIFQDEENPTERNQNLVYTMIFQKKLRVLIDKHYVNCKTEDQLVNVLIELSFDPLVISTLESLNRDELRHLSTILIREEGNTFFFEHLLYQLHSVSNPTNPIPDSVKRVSYFRELWEHVLKCRDKTCGREGCFLSKCVLAHFHECSVYDRNHDCRVCIMTRDSIKQGMKNFNNDLIMKNATVVSTEIVSEKTQESTKKRKAKEVDPNSVDIFFARDEDDEEDEVDIKKHKKEHKYSNLNSSCCRNDANEVEKEKHVDEKAKEENICVICQCQTDESEDKEDKMVIKVDCCSQIYHRECLRQWFERNVQKLTYSVSRKDNTCPTCRRVFKFDKPKKEDK